MYAARTWRWSIAATVRRTRGRARRALADDPAGLEVLTVTSLLSVQLKRVGVTLPGISES